MNFLRIGRTEVVVEAIMGEHFAQIPATKLPGQVTSLEEEKITAFFGAGTLYADPKRTEVWL
jgi:photosynthetic reaction center H subunit